jgi:hypothetical protein
MNVMSKLIVQVTAATFATVITATGAWAFLSASASLDRDPFHFAEVMAANARAHEQGPLLTRNFPRECWSESLGSEGTRLGRTVICRRGG